MELQEILINLVTFLVGGGLVKLWTVRQEIRKSKAEADIQNANATKAEIDATDQIIDVYKKALEDFKAYYEEKENLLIRNNKSLKEEIANLTEQVTQLKRSNDELSIKLRDAETKLDKFNQLYKSLEK